MAQLSSKRKVTIQDFRGKTLVSIREFYRKDGKDLPTAKGNSPNALLACVCEILYVNILLTEYKLGETPVICVLLV